MKTFLGNNVEEVFQIALMSLREKNETVKVKSRNGDVLMFPDPVCSTYKYPNQRVLFMAERNCNPFFHFIEGLWMLAGRRDVKPLARFVKRMEEYSDDGHSLYGAYGYRWRNQFANDQLHAIIRKLQENPYDRRIVLSMWDPIKDLYYDGKDVPCNTQIYFKTRPDDILDMTVMCRSNDLIWGAYGANAVHFSMLHEYVASMSGLHLGRYHQVSNNAHVYINIWERLEKKLPIGIAPSQYNDEIKSLPLIQDGSKFDQDVKWFFNLIADKENNEQLGGMWITPDHFANTNTFAHTALPMVEAWNFYKNKEFEHAIAQASTIQAPDWRKACIEWLERRKQSYDKKRKNKR